METEHGSLNHNVYIFKNVKIKNLNVKSDKINRYKDIVNPVGVAKADHLPELLLSLLLFHPFPCPQSTTSMNLH